MLMQSTTSAPHGGGDRARNGRLGVERYADAQVKLARTCDRLSGVAFGLDVEGHAVTAGFPDLLEVTRGLRGHQVTVEHAALLVHEVGYRLQDDRADRDLVDETVTQVEVKDAGPGVKQRAQLLPKPGEVSGVDRGLDLHSARRSIPAHARAPDCVYAATRRR